MRLPCSEQLEITKTEKVEQILENPWDNVYWFARWLIDTDRYGACGRNNKLMLSISTTIRQMLPELRNESEQLAVDTLVQAVQNLIIGGRSTNTNIYRQLESFIDLLRNKLVSRKDVEVFALTCEKIMIPINRALEVIPNDDRVFAKSFASALLITKKEEGLKTIISKWDDLGLQGCLTAERTSVVAEFKYLRKSLSKILKQQDLDIILTAFVQEFERRLSQKRKGRAGRSLYQFIMKLHIINKSIG